MVSLIQWMEERTLWYMTGVRPHWAGPVLTMPMMVQERSGDLIMRGPPLSPGQADCWLLLYPAQSWSPVGTLAPGSASHSALVRTGTVTAWRVLEWGDPSSTPNLPHPVTVAWVPASRNSEDSGRHTDPMLLRGFTWKGGISSLTCQLFDPLTGLSSLRRATS